MYIDPRGIKPHAGSSEAPPSWRPLLSFAVLAVIGLAAAMLLDTGGDGLLQCGELQAACSNF